MEQLQFYLSMTDGIALVKQTRDSFEDELINEDYTKV
jgi:hypothetical protein